MPKTRDEVRLRRSLAFWVWLMVLSLSGWVSTTAAQEPDLFEGHPQREQLAEEFALGQQAAVDGRLEEAIGHFSTILEMAEGHPLALLSRAQTRMRLGAFAEAAQDYEPLVSAYPDLLPAFRELSEAYLRQGQLAGAILMWS